MSKTLGLTPAMRRVGEQCVAEGSIVFGGLDETIPRPRFDVVRAMHAQNMLKLHIGSSDHFAASEWLPTQQLIAALAAPKMTQAEYDVLCSFDHDAHKRLYSTAALIGNRLAKRGFLSTFPDPIVGRVQFYRTDAGHKALNDVRAAIGSAEYKE
jgi:hypothetical protein